MAVRSILYDNQAQQSILRGVNALANTVRVTLGPRGRNVAMERLGQSPRITKDGVTVALEIEVRDYFENMGTELVRQVAAKTAARAGDGTTTAIVLAQAICREGMKLAAAGFHPKELRLGIEAALAVALAELGAQSREVNGLAEIEVIGTISANGDQAIGKLMAEAIDQVGKDGVITVFEGNGIETTIEVVRGLQFERGLLSPYFMTDFERGECVLEDPYVLLSERPINSMQMLVPILEAVFETKKPILVIADDVTEDAMSTLVINKLRGNLACCAVKCPGWGDVRPEHVRDIAIVTGATPVNDASGLTFDKLKLEHLGRADRVVVTNEMTTIVGGPGDSAELKHRADLLKKDLQRIKSSKKVGDVDKQEAEKRIQRLSRGVAIVRVGGLMEAELKERKDRVEDAFCATQAALASGVLPGGGAALLRCQAALDKLVPVNDEQEAGIKILRHALEAPLRVIAKNAGFDGAAIVTKVREAPAGYGFDAMTGEIRDLVTAGIIDPTRVAQAALECAVQVSALMLTTGAMVGDRYTRPRSTSTYRPPEYDDDDY